MRNFRIALASVMLIASLAWLGLGFHAPLFLGISERSQIIPSSIQSCLGATVFWIIATLLFGRVYCATVCPVGALQDATIWLRKKTGKRKPFRYKEPKKFRYPLLVAYIASLALGALTVGYVVEPWNIVRNVMSTVNPADTSGTWQAAGISVGIGMASGWISFCLITVWAWHSGRGFCTSVCPIGTALGTLHTQTLMHIAIDPDKCISCMKCEDVCASGCIKVEKRLVDNSRCVRCFDCTDVCPNDAIRFQINKERRRQTPLMEVGN